MQEDKQHSIDNLFCVKIYNKATTKLWSSLLNFLVCTINIQKEVKS